MPKPKPQAFFDANGRLLIERRGLPRRVGAELAKDAYHFLRTATWTRIMVLFLAVFLGANLLFAVVLWLGNADVMNAHGFTDYYWFSVQTLATIGYGYLAPNDTLSHVVVAVESFVGIGLTALITGLFFARFSTPVARVLFSKVAVIAEYEGKPTLSFRIANERMTTIVEATVHVYLSRNEVTVDGERVRRIYDLPLRRHITPAFALSWTVYHTIDDTSALNGMTAEDLQAGGANFIVTFVGIDDSLATNIHTRYTYDAENILFDRRFVDVLKFDAATGVRYLDFTPFHDTEAALPRPAREVSPLERA